MIRANLAAKSTRTGQLIEQLLSVALPQGKTPQRWGGLEMFLDKQVRHDSPALNAVYRRFEANLRDICRIARKSGAAVIVSNAGCNLKDSPLLLRFIETALTTPNSSHGNSFTGKASPSKPTVNTGRRLNATRPPPRSMIRLRTCSFAWADAIGTSKTT
jgi:hypothetical protein